MLSLAYVLDHFMWIMLLINIRVIKMNPGALTIFKGASDCRPEVSSLEGSHVV